MVEFIKAGKIRKAYQALRVEIDGVDGDLVIGAQATRDLLTGNRMVEINRVIERDGETIITLVGTARQSVAGKAIVLYLGGARYTSPITQVRAVVAGTRSAALVSRVVEDVAPIIDADAVQAQQNERPITEGLETSW
jgi:hypothetical protein